MPKTSIDFSKTVIYKICCNDANVADIYIGHTTDIRNRRYAHKSSCNNESNKNHNSKVYTCIRENGGWTNWSLIQVEEYPCTNINEARARERYHIELLKPSLNSDVPNRTGEEYYRDNKEVIAEKRKEYREQNKDVFAKQGKEYYKENKEEVLLKSKERYEKNIETVKTRHKAYYDANKDKLNEKAREKITCECGTIIARRDLSIHRLSKKHLSLLKVE
jgi:hypothetical protein